MEWMSQICLGSQAPFTLHIKVSLSKYISITCNYTSRLQYFSAPELLPNCDRSSGCCLCSFQGKLSFPFSRTQSTGHKICLCCVTSTGWGNGITIVTMPYHASFPDLVSLDGARYGNVAVYNTSFFPLGSF